MHEKLQTTQTIAAAASDAGCLIAVYTTPIQRGVHDDFITSLKSELNEVVSRPFADAALGFCIELSRYRKRTVAITQGDGLRQASAMLGLGIACEVPMVIVHIQSGAPAAPLERPGGDGEIIAAGHMTAGSLPFPVLIAYGAKSGYRLVHQAYELSEQIRTPTVILCSPQILHDKSSIDRVAGSKSIDSSKNAFDRGRQEGQSNNSSDDASFHFVDEEDVGPAAIEKRIAHLRGKFISHEKSLILVDDDVDKGADCLVISLGATVMPAREAVKYTRGLGARVSHIALSAIWPVPSRAIRAAITDHVQRVVVAELNTGLYVKEVQKLLPETKIESVTRYDGEPMSSDAIVQHILVAACG